MNEAEITLTKAELSELLTWADNMYTNNVMSTFGGELSDRLWELYKAMQAKEN